MQDHGRDDLIDDVQNGRMSPETAEKEAARLGLPPLAPRARSSVLQPDGRSMVDAGNGNRLDRMAIASQGVRVLGHVPARMLGLALPRCTPGTRHACSRR